MSLKEHGTNVQTSKSIFSRTSPFTSHGQQQTTRLQVRLNSDDNDDITDSFIQPSPFLPEVKEQNDTINYALLVALYTLQGIPMGLSASIPFLIQQKIKSTFNNSPDFMDGGAIASTTSHLTVSANQLSYQANAIFALCSWPFSMKLLWAPIVDSCFLPAFGRRKTWLVPTQYIAGLLMVFGAGFVESQLGLGTGYQIGEVFNVKGVTAYFFALYFLMATQDIAVDGWALTILSKKNRGRGPVCNSIGQNIGYFLSFVGFLALNDADSSEKLWRPLLGLPSIPSQGLVSLGSFLRFMGYFMILVTTVVAVFKREIDNPRLIIDKDAPVNSERIQVDSDNEDTLSDLDASKIGLRETYERLWAVCKLPAVRSLFLILLSYRLPTALSDNVKFLKAVEFGLSKSTTALLSPTVILPLGIFVPIIATKLWHSNPLRQFMHAYKLRVTLVPFIDVLMLLALRRGKPSSASGQLVFWGLIIFSTALQAIVSSLQFNAQMAFFAKRVDPAIGGSYMTLLNTAANLGGTWPASFVMWLISRFPNEPKCSLDLHTGKEICIPGRDPFYGLQLILSLLGCLWIFGFGNKVKALSDLPEDAWRTHILDKSEDPATTDLMSNEADLKDYQRTERSKLS